MMSRTKEQDLAIAAILARIRADVDIAERALAEGGTEDALAGAALADVMAGTREALPAVANMLLEGVPLGGVSELYNTLRTAQRLEIPSHLQESLG